MIICDIIVRFLVIVLNKKKFTKCGDEIRDVALFGAHVSFGSGPTISKAICLPIAVDLLQLWLAQSFCFRKQL
jgi:hypothetical protein